MDLNKIINDIELKLNITIDKDTIVYYTDGATESVVFSIENKYLVKTVDSLTYKAQLAFLEHYKDVDGFQKVVCSSEELQYICFGFIDGSKLVENEFDASNVIQQIYSVVNNYKVYNHAFYGYLYEDEKSWYEFLKDEVEFSKSIIQHLNLEFFEVDNALSYIKTYECEKYLLHGDFGAHNFLLSNNELRVIDPMPVVGDCLYDFYFAVFSDLKLFKDIDSSELLTYFNRDEELKKNMMLIAFYIRLARCYAYTINDFEDYLNYYNYLTKV